MFSPTLFIVDSGMKTECYVWFSTQGINRNELSNKTFNGQLSLAYTSIGNEEQVNESENGDILEMIEQTLRIFPRLQQVEKTNIPILYGKRRLNKIILGLQSIGSQANVTQVPKSTEPQVNWSPSHLVPKLGP